MTLPRPKIIRFNESDQGWLGVLVLENFWCYTLELPWQDNQPNISCIPERYIPPDVYEIELVQANRTIGGRRDLYLIKNVPGRSGVLLHAGTFAGDPKKYKRNSYGCPLLGFKYGIYKNQRAIFQSRDAVAAFNNLMAGQKGELTIRENSHV